jgi:hypothetical protein
MRFTILISALLIRWGILAAAGKSAQMSTDKAGLLFALAVILFGWDILDDVLKRD